VVAVAVAVWLRSQSRRGCGGRERVPAFLRGSRDSGKGRFAEAAVLPAFDAGSPDASDRRSRVVRFFAHVLCPWGTRSAPLAREATLGEKRWVESHMTGATNEVV